MLTSSKEVTSQTTWGQSKFKLRWSQVKETRMQLTVPIATARHCLSKKMKTTIMLSGADLHGHKRLKKLCEDSFPMGRDK